MTSSDLAPNSPVVSSEHGREQERIALEKTLASGSLWLLQRRFVFPDVTIKPDLSRTEGISLDRLLALLGYDQDEINRIFEFKGGKASGRFAPDGIQHLADLLQKEIKAVRLADQHTVIGGSEVDYIPNSKTSQTPRLK